MTVSEAIVRRVERRAGVPGIVEILAERLKPDELTSLLLAVCERRVSALAPAQVLRRYEQDGFVRPVELPSGATEVAIAASFEAAPAFERVELSPLAPIGACATVGPVDQGSIVPTIRSTEVVSDPTNVLALECAVRRRSNPRDPTPVKLATTHRAVRAPRAEGAAMFQHFRLFAAVTAGRDTGSHRFETEALADHIKVHLRALDVLRTRGFTIPTAKIILQRPRDQTWTDAITDAVREAHPSVILELAPRRPTAYYPDVSFSLEVEDACIADGGLVPWTATLLSNKKERLCISALGTDRAVALFG